MDFSPKGVNGVLIWWSSLIHDCWYEDSTVTTWQSHHQHLGGVLYWFLYRSCITCPNSMIRGYSWLKIGRVEHQRRSAQWTPLQEVCVPAVKIWWLCSSMSEDMNICQSHVAAIARKKQCMLEPSVAPVLQIWSL